MRAVEKKGLGEGSEMDWLIKDMHEELKHVGLPRSRRERTHFGK